jgi:hypothetical protein
MLTISGPFVRAAVTGGVLVLMGCSGGGSGGSSSSSLSSSLSGSSSTSAADFDKSLDALCAANVAFNRSLPSLQASQHLSEAQLQAKAKAAGAAFRARVARLTPPNGLTDALHTLTQDEASPPPSPSTPTTASVAATLTWERKLASDYTALGAAGCAADEQQSIASIESLAKKLHLSS